MTTKESAPPSSRPPSNENDASVYLGDLGFDKGAHLLVEHALRRVPVGARVLVTSANAIDADLRAWCRTRGHELELVGGACFVRRGSSDALRMQRAPRTRSDEIVESPSATWGLAPRGASIEEGCPAFDFSLCDKNAVWTDDAGRLYAQAVAAQWDPASAIPWTRRPGTTEDVENAVVQVMTYLVENETAALMVPARFVARLHPHFREVMQLLAVQTADEARHIEVFTRRALLCRDTLGTSTIGGQASLKTLLDEPEFAIASFLLSVLGEGTFLSLLHFLHAHAPDVVTREVTRLVAQDEARHVAFGVAHLERHLGIEPGYRHALAGAVRRRHDALATTAGLNAEVFDALVVIAAGSFETADIARGWDAVVDLVQEMDRGRRKRLERIGFDAQDARELSALHTRNFM